MSQLSEVEESVVEKVEESSTPQPEATPEEVSRRKRPRPGRRGGQMKAVRRRARGYLSR